MSVENPLDVDPLNLDEEWVEQPRLIAEWAKKAAGRQFDYDTAKSQLTLIEAELSQEVRNSPDEFGISKVSNEAVSNAVRSQPGYKKAVESVTQARYELELASGMVTAIEHKKRALTMLVELWTRDYYSGFGNKISDEKKNEVRSRGRRRREDERDVE